MPDYERIIEEIFNPPLPHPCTHPGCPHTVAYDDEPWCFIHSPDSGSLVPGYSYRASHGTGETKDR